MVKRIASAEVVGIVLLAACGAWCQSARESLPDAPSAVAAQALRSNALVEDARSPLSFGGMSAPGRSMRQDGFLVYDRAAARHKDLEAIFRKYLYRSPAGQPSNARSATDGSLMGRATHAAARTVVMRNEAGKGRLNTSYL